MRELLERGTIIERVSDYAPWWSLDVNVKVGDLFEYVGPTEYITEASDVVHIRPLDRRIRRPHWNLTMHHFIRPNGTIAKTGQCIWK